MPQDKQSLTFPYCIPTAEHGTWLFLIAAAVAFLVAYGLEPRYHLQAALHLLSLLVGTILFLSRSDWSPSIVVSVALLSIAYTAESLPEIASAPYYILGWLLVALFQERFAPEGLSWLMSPSLTFTLLLILPLLGLSYAEYYREAEASAFAQMRGALVAALILMLLRTGVALRLLAWVMVLLALPLALAGIVDTQTTPLIQSAGEHVYQSDTYADSLSEWLPSAGRTAVMLVPLAVLSFERFCSTSNLIARGLALATTVLSLIAVSPTSAFNMALAIVSILFVGYLNRQLLTAGLTALCCLSGVLILGLLFYGVGLSPDISGGAAVPAMLEGFTTPLRMLAAKPFMGVGAGNMWLSLNQYGQDAKVTAAAGFYLQQNAWLQLTVETGLIGLSAFLATLLLIVRHWRRAVRQFKQSSRGDLISLAQALLVGLGVHLVAGGFHNISAEPTVFWGVYWVFAALILALPRVARYEIEWGDYGGHYLEIEN